jgi:hypothetical protein
MTYTSIFAEKSNVERKSLVYVQQDKERNYKYTKFKDIDRMWFEINILYPVWVSMLSNCLLKFLWGPRNQDL